MEGYGGLAQPSPTISQMPERRLRLARNRVLPLQDEGEHAAGCHSTAARYADLKAGAVLSMPILRHKSLQAAGPHDQINRAARDHTLQVGVP